MKVNFGEEMRLPPQNIEAEKGVLGSLLISGPALLDVMPILKADDFYRDSHRAIYRAVVRLHDAGSPVDSVTVMEELTRTGEFERVGGSDALFEIVNSIPHAANAEYYAGIVREKATARRVQEALTDSMKDVYSNEYTSDELLRRVESRLFAIGDQASTGGPSAVSGLIDSASDRLVRRERGELTGISTGFRDLDAIMGGLPRRGLIIIAARPGQGKSALALNVCENVVYRDRVPTLIFSLEMGNDESADRLIISRSGVDGHRFRMGDNLTADEHRRICEACDELRATDCFWIDDRPNLDVSQIAAVSRRHKARYGLGLVVVDYMQLIEGVTGTRQSRQEQIAHISRRLKMLAKELDVPVISMSQLNRDCESREDKRPRMSDLRESGAIEQDADVILLLHRPEYYDSKDRPGEADVIVAKQRNGRTATIRMDFIGSEFRFANYQSAAGNSY